MFRQLLRSRDLFRPFMRPALAPAIHNYPEPLKPTRLLRYFSNELTANWPEAIKNFLVDQGITSPTLVQEKTLPLIVQNKDVVGIARTGSGKTLAFVIPAVMRILRESNENEAGVGKVKPTCLVLAPTRELAAQINGVFSKFRKLNVRTLALVGGADRSYQVMKLNQNDCHAFVATPGRLIDLVNQKIVDLSSITYVVLDEADRMLDMGFEPQIREILARVPKKRQTLLWSATWPEETQSLASEFTNDPEFVAIDSEKLKANPNINQVVQVCQPGEKSKLLVQQLSNIKEENENPRVLIFTNTKRNADSLMMHLMRYRIRAVVTHGDKSQRQRDAALSAFKRGACDIMIATDVAARGLDIGDITHVINFDFPPTIEDYVHRIGRTARYDKKGTSISFITELNASLARKLIETLKETSQPVSEQLVSLSRRKFSSARGNPRGPGPNNFSRYSSRSYDRRHSSYSPPYSDDEGIEYDRRNARIE